MAIELNIPSVGESIQEVQIGQWLKTEGQWVDREEDLVDIETEKATVQLTAPQPGYLSQILKREGEFAEVGEVIAMFEPSDVPADQPVGGAAGAVQGESSLANADEGAPIMPAAQRLLDEYQLDPASIHRTGPGDRMLKEDVVRSMNDGGPAEAKPATHVGALPTAGPTIQSDAAAKPVATAGSAGRDEELVPMSLMRRTIASRLVQAQQSAALLTTFNEIDMQPVSDLRQNYRDRFLEKHGVKLGFMSFFTKASVEALKRFPAVNAEVRGNDIAYRNYYDVGIAIGGGRGLVVPILRNVERMSFAEIEKAIGRYAAKASDNKLSPSDLEGGTFTISNGGVYGSLLSTPIINPPQSGILGLHAIQERPVAVNGQVVIRPMMYVALTYDHRIVDGREAVGFLKCIQEVLEEPARLFLEV